MSILLFFRVKKKKISKFINQDKTEYMSVTEGILKTPSIYALPSDRFLKLCFGGLFSDEVLNFIYSS